MVSPQVIDREKQKDRGFAVTRIVADAGIEAAQKPIHLIVPAVAAVFSLRTVALGLQIFVENEMFKNTNKVASESLFWPCYGAQSGGEVWGRGDTLPLGLQNFMENEMSKISNKVPVGLGEPLSRFGDGCVWRAGHR